MKAEIYQWIRTLAVFYIVFSMVLHLVPDLKYERYIRLFMGLLLIYILCAAMLTLFGRGQEMVETFHSNYQKELAGMEIKNMQNLQSLYIRDGFEEELEKEIMEECDRTGIKAGKVVVHINSKKITTVLYLKEEPDREQERRMYDVLAQNFGIQEKDCQFIVGNDGETAMAGDSASGTAFDGSGTSGFRNGQ
ncbi:stage III sporulation protein AF [Blautia sp. MSJ-19]|uniref:stage III sporulation protein AF n=1 Tax=Blautia sp. MSJ-19 TaxID=2841517 RepID=UPI001C0EE717|nr:stage III sporulation protein AF [Blautia sp. MSJ-19]MBU5480853.1 stage III sporulation protein AF [Blautia sp. MSJ-19]